MRPAPLSALPLGRSNMGDCEDNGRHNDEALHNVLIESEEHVLDGFARVRVVAEKSLTETLSERRWEDEGR